MAHESSSGCQCGPSHPRLRQFAGNQLYELPYSVRGLGTSSGTGKWLQCEECSAVRPFDQHIYQSLRPTNVLKDAANNTSLAPLDLGDGPAGTRVAGHAIVALERFMIPASFKVNSNCEQRTSSAVGRSRRYQCSWPRSKRRAGGGLQLHG